MSVDKAISKFKEYQKNKKTFIEPKIDQRPGKYWHKCRGKCPKCGFIGVIDNKDGMVNFSNSIWYNRILHCWECVLCYLD
jgi:hypothetical protein